MPSPIEQWYREVPPISRIYLTALIAVTLAAHIGSVTMFQLYYDFELTFFRGQLWRLFTTFLYFGPFSFNWAFHTYFMVQYMRDLEEGSFRNRSADFLWFLVLSGVLLLACSAVFTTPFQAPALSFVIIYVWAQRNPHVLLNLLGLFTFRAPYFPFVMIGISYLFNNQFPVQSLLGLAVGHLYYFLEDVWPHNPASGQRRWLSTPPVFERLVSALLHGPRPLPIDEAPLHESGEAVPSPPAPAAAGLRQRPGNLVADLVSDSD
ncbi:hypothetical protein H4R33_001422 [Dimargaris cristalligena]|uniref:Derlin n=1 Tax=Dimargaris cristalligena TaxID=215637 RepID=A0A4P9ZXK7_9FUNG|nr:hypothetical protein H4R33_001422 [Dimargaris cristalligena]RKP37642.1 Der1-like protein [Dimargaris cristalligena]|eukprot:RKP37642.1 Der1-like protein [Dimargaris cristalligena]